MNPSNSCYQNQSTSSRFADSYSVFQDIFSNGDHRTFRIECYRIIISLVSLITTSGVQPKRPFCFLLPLTKSLPLRSFDPTILSMETFSPYDSAPSSSEFYRQFHPWFCPTEYILRYAKKLLITTSHIMQNC